MSKLFFRYGTVGSAKSLNLQAVFQNYRYQNKKTLILVSGDQVRKKFDHSFLLDTSTGNFDGHIDEKTQLEDFNLEQLKCILIDDCHFLPISFVDHIRLCSLKYDIPIICYGLKVDYQSHLFPASKRLFEVSDSVEEIKTTCACCNKKAVFNYKLEKKPENEKKVFLPMCPACYFLSRSEGDVQFNIDNSF